MEDCVCNGKKEKYMDIISFECEDKKPNGIYEKTSESGMIACWDVCQIRQSDPRCPKPSISDTKTLSIFKVIQYLSSNINIPNKYTKSLISTDKLSNYESELAELSPETVCAIGSAKILPKHSMNSELANIMNIYGSVIYSQTKDTEFNSNESIEAMSDLGCSAGQLNIYFQGIENKYNFEKFTSIKELEEFITIDDFKSMIKDKIMSLVEYVNLNKRNFISIEYIEGDNIGGDGSGSYNSKYLLFYIVKFLVTNKNLKTIESLSIIFDEEILSKYRSLNEKVEIFSSYEQKYLKYKTKYLKFKELLNKMY